jgi:hypothetical protein
MNIDDFLEPLKKDTPSLSDLGNTGVLTDFLSFDFQRLESRLFFEGTTDDERLASVQSAIQKGINPNIFTKKLQKHSPFLGIDPSFSTLLLNPFTDAVEQKYPKTAQYLLDHGANPNVLDSHFKPIFLKILSSFPVSFSENLIMKYGANPYLKDHRGQTIIDHIDASLADPLFKNSYDQLSSHRQVITSITPSDHLKLLVSPTHHLFTGLTDQDRLVNLRFALSEGESINTIMTPDSNPTTPFLEAIEKKHQASIDFILSQSPGLDLNVTILQVFPQGFALINDPKIPLNLIKRAFDSVPSDSLKTLFSSHRGLFIDTFSKRTLSNDQFIERYHLALDSGLDPYGVVDDAFLPTILVFRRTEDCFKRLIAETSFDLNRQDRAGRTLLDQLKHLATIHQTTPGLEALSQLIKTKHIPFVESLRNS